MIHKLPNWCIPDNHPAFFDSESATTIEMVAKLYGAMKLLIEDSNATTEEQNKIIADAVDYFKGNLSDTIRSEIEKMKENGELNDEIMSGLGNLNDNFIVNTKADLTFNRKFRILKERYRYGSDEYRQLYEKTAFSLQSICAYNNNLILGYTNSDSTKSTLEERNQEGGLIRSVDLPLGHCNSLTMIETKIYVCTLNNIVVVDYNTFQIIESFQLDRTLRALAYDKVTGELYGAGGDYYFKVDLNTKKCECLFQSNHVQGGTFQSLCVNDGIFYEVSTTPELLTVFTTEGKIIGSYNIARYSGYDYFGEAEDVEFVDNKLIICSQWQMSYDNYRHDYVWEIPVGANYTFKPVVSSFTLNGLMSIYCDSNSTSLSPDGTQGNPFRCISECLSVLQSPVAIDQKITDIHLTGTFNEHVYVRNMNFRMIGPATIKTAMSLQTCDAYLEKIYLENDDSSIVKTFNAQHSHVNGMGATFKTLLPKQDYMITLSYSKLIAHGAFIPNPETVTTPISLYFGEVVGNNKNLIENAYHVTPTWSSASYTGG